MMRPEAIPSDVYVSPRAFMPFRERLGRLFRDMDDVYGRVAGVYGFNCEGCPDNCCKTRFYHHTLIEYLYVQEGYLRLETAKRQAAARLSEEICKQWADSDRSGKRIRLWCPLNSDGRCEIYPFRPMICRLHGLPSELNRPDRPVQYTPGCGRFSEECEGREYVPFDRTPFYYRLAELDGKLRGAIGFEKKIRLTIADMIERFESGPQPPKKPASGAQGPVDRI